MSKIIYTVRKVDKYCSLFPWQVANTNYLVEILAFYYDYPHITSVVLYSVCAVSVQKLCGFNPINALYAVSPLKNLWRSR
jgi:hypothetical protein